MALSLYPAFRKLERALMGKPFIPGVSVYVPTKPRYRRKDLITEVANCSEWSRGTSCGHDQWTLNSGPFPILGGSFSEMSDVVVPNFKKRQSKGETFFNAMSSLKREYTCGFGWGGAIGSIAQTCNSPQMWAQYDLRGNWLPHVLSREVVGDHNLPQYAGLILPAQVKSMQKEVSTETWNDRGRSDNNLWESLAEVRRTVDMLYIPMRKLDRLINSAQKAHRERRYLGYSADGVSNLWLKYRYGIKPLVQDVMGVVDGLQRETGKRRVSTRAREVETRTDTLYFTASHGIAVFHIRNDVTHKCTVRGMSLDEVNLSLVNNIGFTTKGLLTLPWELFSYSFVYDWIINFGDFIGAVTPAFGWNQLGHAMTTKHEIENSFSFTGAESTNGNYAFYSQPTGGDYKIKITGKSRQALQDPGLVVKNDFRFSTFTRKADAIALIAQRFNRVFR